MRPRAAIALAVALALAAVATGDAVRSEVARLKRQQDRQIHRDADPSRRRIDLGIEVRVVVADQAAGAHLIHGAPKLRVVARHYAGGIYDRKEKRFVAGSQRRTVFYASREQFAIALHSDAEPLGQLIYGSEGGGKTEALVLWHLFRWLEHIGERREGGQVAPSYARLEVFLEKFRDRVPQTWFRYRSSKRLITMCDGTRIRLLSTARRSKEDGSPIQGYGWSWAGMDEAQDSVARFDDMQSRGRAARIREIDGEPVSWYKQARCATAKDTTQWRDARDKLLKTNLWCKRTLRGLESPFIPRKFWEHAKATMSPREFQRRVLAIDVGPERQLYNTFLRGEHPAFDGNVRMLPLGAEDVTASVLATWGRNLTVLVGHDPGKLFDVSVFLKAYRCPMTKEERQRREAFNIPLHDWYVVGEVTTEQSTTDSHVLAVLAYAQEKWNVNQVDRKGRPVVDGERMLVRADPYSNTAVSDDQPHRTVYTVWKQHGVQIAPAAGYLPADAGQIPKIARVPREARIEMLCRLLCSADGRRRFFILCDDERRVVAPRLLEALETMERDELGRAETQRKDKHDMSHWPASPGYALWLLEKPRLYREAA